MQRQTRHGRTGAHVRSNGAGQAAKEDQGKAGLIRKAPVSKTEAVAASATASDVGEHAAFERHWEAGGLRIAQRK